MLSNVFAETHFHNIKWCSSSSCLIKCDATIRFIPQNFRNFLQLITLIFWIMTILSYGINITNLILGSNVCFRWTRFKLMFYTRISQLMGRDSILGYKSFWWVAEKIKNLMWCFHNVFWNKIKNEYSNTFYV